MNPDPHHTVKNSDNFVGIENFSKVNLNFRSVRGSKCSPRRSVDQWFQICITLMRINVKIWIRIRIKGKGTIA
jgi:hypothetical protein